MANRIISKRLVGVSATAARRSRWWKRIAHLPEWQQRLCLHLAWAGTRFANRILPGYTSPNDAAKYEMIVDHDGPASYTANGGAGGFITGGDTINASDVGMGGFEACGVDSLVNAQNVTGGPFGGVVVEVKLGGAANGIPLGATALASATMFWFQSPTRGTEFTTGNNLSSAFVRLRIMAV